MIRPPAHLSIDLEQLRSWAGIGVAGNFAGHLEQAGEAADFVAVEAAAGAPKGLFPFYLPGHGSFLAEFPLSHDAVRVPAGDGDAGRVQIEPEVALACEVEYAPDGAVAGLTPLAFGAFDDCSIRRPGAAKISEKKNWGAGSKGVAARFIPLGGASLERASEGYRLACFLARAGEIHPYGIDSPLSGYSYFGRRLLDWVVERLERQRGGACSPLEPVGEYLRRCGRPARLLVAIGATRYTPFGESTFLRPGDEAIVVVYDSREQDPGGIAAALRDGRPLGGAASVLRRRVASAAAAPPAAGAEGRARVA